MFQCILKWFLSSSLSKAKGDFFPNIYCENSLEILEVKLIKSVGFLMTKSPTLNLSFFSSDKPPTTCQLQFILFYCNTISKDISAYELVLQETVILHICLTVTPVWEAVVCPMTSLCFHMEELSIVQVLTSH